MTEFLLVLLGGLLSVGGGVAGQWYAARLDLGRARRESEWSELRALWLAADGLHSAIVHIDEVGEERSAAPYSQIKHDWHVSLTGSQPFVSRAVREAAERFSQAAAKHYDMIITASAGETAQRNKTNTELGDARHALLDAITSAYERGAPVLQASSAQHARALAAPKSK